MFFFLRWCPFWWTFTSIMYIICTYAVHNSYCFSCIYVSLDISYLFNVCQRCKAINFLDVLLLFVIYGIWECKCPCFPFLDLAMRSSLLTIILVTSHFHQWKKFKNYKFYYPLNLIRFDLHLFKVIVSYLSKWFSVQLKRMVNGDVKGRMGKKLLCIHG